MTKSRITENERNIQKIKNLQKLYEEKQFSHLTLVNYSRGHNIKSSFLRQVLKY